MLGLVTLCLLGLCASQAVLRSQLTGADALQTTRPADVQGTDLGISFEHKGRLRFFFGDTFGFEQGSNPGPEGGNWRSNTLATGNNFTDPNNGVWLESWIMNKIGAAELIHSLKVDNIEMTCIPTAVWSDDSTIYTYYMSVRHWGAPGQWICNNASIATSVDDGQSFTKQTAIAFPGNGSTLMFGVFQGGVLGDEGVYAGTCPLDSSMLYLFATPCGRSGAAVLVSAPKSGLLSRSQYSVFTGLDHSGNPQWSPDLNAGTPVLAAPLGELSVMWSTYLQLWTVWYLDPVRYAIVLRTASCPYGEWSQPTVLLTGQQYPELYGGFVHPLLVDGTNGRFVYFVVSIFTSYNTFVFQYDLANIGKSVL